MRVVNPVDVVTLEVDKRELEILYYAVAEYVEASPVVNTAMKNLRDQLSDLYYRVTANHS